MKRLLVPVFMSLLLGSSGQCHSQLASLHGIVKDASGAVVPATVVRVSGRTSKVAREAITDVNGEFVMTGLKPGLYAVEAKFPGFYKYRLENLRLRSGASHTLKIQLDLQKGPSYLGKIKEPFGMVVERIASSEFETELIAKAETVPCPNGVWTLRGGDSVRWPVCLNKEAVDYYMQLIGRYKNGDFPFSYPQLEIGRAYYHAEVSPSAGKTWTVNMKLEYADYCGDVCGTSFEIIRVIHFDQHGKIIGVEGDDEGAHGTIS